MCHKFLEYHMFVALFFFITYEHANLETLIAIDCALITVVFLNSVGRCSYVMHFFLSMLKDPPNLSYI